MSGRVVSLALLREVAGAVPVAIPPAAFIDLVLYVEERAAAALPNGLPSGPEASPTCPPDPVQPQGQAVRSDAWTPEDDARLKELVALSGGNPALSDLSAAMGRSIEAIRARLSKLRNRDADLPPARTCWSEEEDKALIKGRAAGVPYSDLAEQMGRSFRACEQRHVKLRAAAARAARAPAEGAAVSVPPVRKSPQKAAAPAPNPTPAQTKPVPNEPPASVQRAGGVITQVRASTPQKDRARAVLTAAIEDKLTGRQIRIVSHLLTLPSNFTTADDLFLAEGLVSRRQMGEISDQLGCSAKDITARWRSMMSSDIADRHGHITIDGQTDLLIVLRWMLGREAADA